MTPTDRWRRGLGLVFLAVSLLLLVGGFTDAGSSLRGATFLLYWLACAVSAIFALFIALIDLAVVRARGRAERWELAHKTAEEMQTAVRQEQGKAAPDKPVADVSAAHPHPVRASGESGSISHSCPSAGSTPPEPPPPK